MLLKLGRFSSVFGVLTFRGFYFHHLIAKLWKMIFSTLWVNYKNKFQIFLKTSTKKIALDKAYMTYLPRLKHMIPDLLCKVKTREELFRNFYHLDFILEYKFCKLIIFVFFNRKSLFRQIFWHEDVKKNLLLKNSLVHHLQKWTEWRSQSNSVSDLSGFFYCLGINLFTVLQLKLSKWIFPQF